eukprot:TRINITY_DN2584_c0_g1_i3.p1 TRINITY_DN2584_c0_g1~~TRINITY_DN2584_c0_g1_i3.p1  ORF type:complete len:160 (+),score=33.72 TRINITY_DN2584_c0_g1_i3:106-585(+)
MYVCLPLENIRKKSKKEPLHCIFCPSHKQETTLPVFEDEHIIIFPDIAPKAHRHYLVIPKVHLRDIDSLRYEHLPLLRRMAEAGEQLLRAESNGAPTKMGFHRYPFTSVDHLHLHLLILPYTAFWKRIKYEPLFSYKWYLPIDVAIRLLEEKAQISSTM